MSIDVMDCQSAQSGSEHFSHIKEHYIEVDKRREEFFEDPNNSFTWEQVKKGLKRA